MDDYELARITGKVVMNRKSEEKKQQSGSPAQCFFYVDKFDTGHFSAGKIGEWRNEVWRGQ